VVAKIACGDSPVVHEVGPARTYGEWRWFVAELAGTAGQRIGESRVQLLRTPVLLFFRCRWREKRAKIASDRTLARQVRIQHTMIRLVILVYARFLLHEDVNRKVQVTLKRAICFLSGLAQRQLSFKLGPQVRPEVSEGCPSQLDPRSRRSKHRPRAPYLRRPRAGSNLPTGARSTRKVPIASARAVCSTSRGFSKSPLPSCSRTSRCPRQNERNPPMSLVLPRRPILLR
jgi:hypothetical protein